MQWQKNYSLILIGEESFARAVALGLWVKRPLTAWYYLLPGMFLFEFLRRSSTVRRYTEVFLFPRKLALDLGLRMVKGEEKIALIIEAEKIIGEWLSGVRLFSPKIQERHIGQIELLLSHYVRLLQAEGDSYHSLIRAAYLFKRDYEDFLEELTLAEGRVDAAIAEFWGQTEQIWKRLRAEQEQVALLRKKQVEEIFLADE